MTEILLRSGKDPWQTFDARATLREHVLGTNLGNLLFSSAVHKILSTRDVDPVSNRWQTAPELADVANERFDAFVVPLANAFRLSFRDDLEALTAFISRLRIPVVVVGVGAQTAINGDPKRLKPMEDEAKRFIAAVLDRSATLGVRGEFTADYVRSLGFDSVEVIGCPSMFLWGPRLSVRTQQTGLQKNSPIALNVSPYVKKMAPIVATLQDIFDDITYLPQDTKTLRMMLDRTGSDVQPELSQVPTGLRHPLFAKNRARFFLDPWPWIDFLETRKFSVGTRIHGTIAAVLGGTPAFLLAHDSRTVELARYHEIPHQRVSVAATALDPFEWFQRADYAAAERGHAARFDHYLRFLERNGLAHAYQEGESVRAFDDKIASVKFPGPVMMKPEDLAGRARLGATRAVRASRRVVPRRRG